MTTLSCKVTSVEAITDTVYRVRLIPEADFNFRAGQYLILGARARALLEGRFHVTTDDIKYVAKPVLRHRIMTTFQADSQGVTPDEIIERLLKHVPVELHEQARKRTGKTAVAE